MKRLAFAALILVLAGTTAALAATRTERIRFDRGTTGTSVRGSIEGFDVVKYLLGARRGQSIEMTLRSGNDNAAFNVAAPRTGRTLFDGMEGGSHWEGRLPADGDYVITVYLTRDAARHREDANYRLRIDIAPGRGGTMHDDGY